MALNVRLVLFGVGAPLADLLRDGLATQPDELGFERGEVLGREVPYLEHLVSVV